MPERVGQPPIELVVEVLGRESAFDEPHELLGECQLVLSGVPLRRDELSGIESHGDCFLVLVLRRMIFGLHRNKTSGDSACTEIAGLMSSKREDRKKY